MFESFIEKFMRLRVFLLKIQLKIPPELVFLPGLYMLVLQQKERATVFLFLVVLTFTIIFEMETPSVKLFLVVTQALFFHFELRFSYAFFSN